MTTIDHAALRAADLHAAKGFHAAALAAGGADNGAPGPRRGGVYPAFALDPDRNNIEATVRA